MYYWHNAHVYVLVGGTVLVKSFAHLNRIFFLATLEEIGKHFAVVDSL